MKISVNNWVWINLQDEKIPEPITSYSFSKFCPKKQAGKNWLIWKYFPITYTYTPPFQIQYFLVQLHSLLCYT